MSNQTSDFDVLIVGAGLSGMSAYLEAKNHSSVRIGMVEYEDKPGGELRYYPGFKEAGEVLQAFLACSSTDSNIHYQTTALGVLPAFREGDPLEVSVSAAAGARTVTTRKLLVCTGTFDSSRENNRLPGQRPAGVYTPSFAVRVMERGALPGRNLVVHVESRRDVELVKQLSETGAKLEAAIGDAAVLERFQAELAHLETELIEYSRVVNIEGSARVAAVTIRTATGDRRIACDTLIYASGRHSNLFALKGSDVEMNANTGGVLVNEFGVTSLPGVYAAGTCVDLHEAHVNSPDSGRRVMEHIIHTLSLINS